MKVLIETIKNRKGYKHFKDENDMNDYLSKHSDSIANYEILNEYDVAVEETNEMLQSFIDAVKQYTTSCSGYSDSTSV